MTAAVLTTAAASRRLLVHIAALPGRGSALSRQPALVRLETKIGRDFADRLVSALSDADRRR
ncbi:MAG: hypothetical protein KatS3mg012_1515 [Gaiellaceae bacterium]|jgi:hypothetical protein|nr:MAG: hypothetical protein KatS3mg012_1515 [Gaiellaceae bacterium]